MSLARAPKAFCPSCWAPTEHDQHSCHSCGFGSRRTVWLPESPKDRELAGGKYRLVEPLGAGGFGYTAKAVQYCDERPLGTVALKFQHEPIGRDAPADLIQEAAALRAVSHPNIVVLHDVHIEEKERFLVMEYVDGSSLQHAVRYQESVSLDFVVRVGAQVSDALSALHSKGVVHCDLTLWNVALVPWLQPTPLFVKILDFGIAALWKKRSGYAAAGAGTPGFCAPELLVGAPSPRSDVFSLGVLLFWLLSGELPYAPELTLDPEKMVRAEPPELGGSVPPELEHLVRRCLHPVEEQRYPAPPTRDLRRLQAAGLVEVRSPSGAQGRDSQAILKIAKETFLSAGLAKTQRERKELYLRAADYFDEAEQAAPLPAAFSKMAERARQHARTRVPGEPFWKRWRR